MAWTDPRDGEGLWWKLANRNKRTICLDLKDPADREVLLRPRRRRRRCWSRTSGPARWSASVSVPTSCWRRNPRLVITRVSGFGQTGPYASRPGFASIAEAMSGFAALNGLPDGQPLPPPIALTDEVTGLAAAFATLVAVHSGRGQVVDVNLLESLFQLMGPLPSLYAVQRRAAAPARGRAPLLGAPGHVPLRRREVDRRVDEQRVGGRTDPRRARGIRRRHGSSRSPVAASTATTSSG